MAEYSILVVEDEEDILELVRYNLAKEGYSLTCVMSGEEALEQIRSNPADLVVLDLMLPGVDGLEVCKQIKNDPDTKHIPIIMLTAKSEEADIVTGLELGADGIDDINVRTLGAAAHVIRLPRFALRDHLPDGNAMVLYIKPVAHLHPVTINRQRLAGERIEDHQWNQLLRELIRAVIVRAVGGEDG